MLPLAIIGAALWAIAWTLAIGLENKREFVITALLSIGAGVLSVAFVIHFWGSALCRF